jgi:hypothetical protein
LKPEQIETEIERGDRDREERKSCLYLKSLSER